MYVFGGYDGSAWLNDMFDFDFERGSSIAELKNAVCCLVSSWFIAGTQILGLHRVSQRRTF